MPVGFIIGIPVKPVGGITLPEILVTDHYKIITIYLTKDDLANMVELPMDTISVSHVDRAPNREDAVVRITLMQACTT